MTESLERSASKHKEKSGKYWEGLPIEESRQHYANVRIAEFQRAQRDLKFEELLHAFRYFGQEYDRGARLGSSSYAEWSLLPACALGAPHTRERVFIVAHADSLGRQTIPISPRRIQAEGRSQLREFVGTTDIRVWAETNGAVVRKVDALPSDVDRLTALGNAVYPDCAEYVGRLIAEGEKELRISA